jgi:hypothetical protein
MDARNCQPNPGHRSRHPDEETRSVICQSTLHCRTRPFLQTCDSRTNCPFPSRCASPISTRSKSRAEFAFVPGQHSLVSADRTDRFEQGEGELLKLGSAVIRRQLPSMSAYVLLPELDREFGERFRHLLSQENAWRCREKDRAEAPPKALKTQAGGAGQRQTGFCCHLIGDQALELNEHLAQTLKRVAGRTRRLLEKEFRRYFMRS